MTHTRREPAALAGPARAWSTVGRDVTPHQYILCRRIERRVTDLCRARGIAGDPLAEVPSCGTLDQELASVDVWLDLPRDLRRDAVALRMCRAAVLSHESPESGPASSPPANGLHGPQSPAIRRAFEEARHARPRRRYRR